MVARLGRVVTSEFLSLIAGLPRRKVALLYRLVTGPLQRHLWIIRCADEPTCQYCGTAPETVSLILLLLPGTLGSWLPLDWSRRPQSLCSQHPIFDPTLPPSLRLLSS